MADELFTLGKLEFGVFVVRFSFDDGLEVSEGVAGVEDGCVGDCTPPVCLFTSVTDSTVGKAAV